MDSSSLYYASSCSAVCTERSPTTPTPAIILVAGKRLNMKYTTAGLQLILLVLLISISSDSHYCHGLFISSSAFLPLSRHRDIRMEMSSPRKPQQVRNNRGERSSSSSSSSSSTSNNNNNNNRGSSPSPRDEDREREGSERSWVDKLYDSIFFYGLNAEPSMQRLNRRRGAGQRQMRSAIRSIDDRDLPWNPFFTTNERQAMTFFNGPETETSSSSTVSSKNTRNKYDSSNNNNNNIKRGSVSMDSHSLSLRLGQLDVYLEALTGDLELVDAELETMLDISSEDRRELLERRDKLDRALQSAKVEFVNISAELELLNEAMDN